MRRTEEIGDLPLYDPTTYEQTLEAGSWRDRDAGHGDSPTASVTCTPCGPWEPNWRCIASGEQSSIISEQWHSAVNRTPVWRLSLRATTSSDAQRHGVA